MNLLTKLKSIFNTLNIPFETGYFKDNAPDVYVVAVPLTDTYDIHGDNFPGVTIEEVRLSLFSKGNYSQTKERIIEAMFTEEITITNRNYVTYERETGYHHYNIDVADYFLMEEN